MLVNVRFTSEQVGMDFTRWCCQDVYTRTPASALCTQTYEHPPHSREFWIFVHSTISRKDVQKYVVAPRTRRNTANRLPPRRPSHCAPSSETTQPNQLWRVQHSSHLPFRDLSICVVHYPWKEVHRRSGTDVPPDVGILPREKRGEYLENRLLACSVDTRESCFLSRKLDSHKGVVKVHKRVQDPHHSPWYQCLLYRSNIHMPIVSCKSGWSVVGLYFAAYGYW